MNKTTNNPQIEQHYRAKECAKLAGVGLSTWWNWVKSGRVSKGVKLSPAITVWPESALLEIFKPKRGEIDG